MLQESRMYLEVEKRNDWVKINGYSDKFYPHPELKDVYVSRSGLVARTGPIKTDMYLMTQSTQNSGYYRVSYSVNGIMLNKLVHRLVLETFDPRPEGDYVVDHIDNDKSNNCLSNLQWLSRRENLRKRDLTGGLLKNTYVYDRVTDMLTMYPSRIEAAKAIGLQTSNLTTAIKYGSVVKGRYYITDDDIMTSEDYYYEFKSYDIKKEAKNKKREGR